RVRGLDVVVAAHRLVHAEGAHEARDRRGHAVARVGIDVVAAEAGLHQLVGGVALPHRPLAGAEHADAVAALGLEHGLELLRHHVEGFLPADRGEVAVLGEHAVPLAQQRRGQPVGAVEHLRQEIALDAVEAAIDLGQHVAVGGHHAAVVDRDVDATAGAAVAARGLAPLELAIALDHGIGQLGRQRQTGGQRGAGNGAVADEVAAAGAHPGGSCVGAAACADRAGGCVSMWWYTRLTAWTPGTASIRPMLSINAAVLSHSCSNTLRVASCRASSIPLAAATASASAGAAVWLWRTTRLATCHSRSVSATPLPPVRPCCPT